MHCLSLQKTGSIITFPVPVTAPTRCPSIFLYSGFCLTNYCKIKTIENLCPSGQGTLSLPPHQECAEILGVSAKAVETRVYRARKILEKKIQHRGIG